MIGSRPILTDCLAMHFGRIPLVLVPMILGIFLVNLEHEIVSISLCQDAGRSDTHVFPISLHNGCVRQVLIFVEPIAAISND